MRSLFNELVRVIDTGTPCVYCSVVETRGSTPQKAGAAMLVFADGSQSGTLGGGCVEAEVKRRALLRLGDSAAGPEILTFSLDDDYGWDDGLICGGRMTMLVAPVTPDFRDYYRPYRERIDNGAGVTEAVVLANGSRYLFDVNGQLLAKLADADPPAEMLANLKPMTDRPKPYVAKGVAYLPHLPRITLLIVGGGHVGQAVADLAATVEFDVWVLDDREKYVDPGRFPHATRRLVGDIGRTLQSLVPEIHPGIYCLVITRGHNHDEEALYHLANTKAGYVGMIGSKRKIRMIFEDLVAKGISEGTLARVHAPLGFPIGSQTVPEIAISIVAELIACRNLANPRPKLGCPA